MDEAKKQITNKEEEIKVLRTYSSDMAEAIKKNEMSVIKVALAEKEKKEKESLIENETKTTNNFKKLLIVGGIVLIVIAIIASSLLIGKKKQGEIIVTPESNVETLISYDSKASLDVTSIADASGLVDLIKKNTQITSGQVEAFLLTRTLDEVVKNLDSKDFIFLINGTAPSTLVRSLSENYLLGKYLTSDKKTTTFLILQTTDYSQAYASMLEWESSMLKDLSVLFSTDSTNQKNTKWKDVVIDNKDARVLYGDNGEEILYYVFVGENNFVITDNVDALKEVISRLIIKNPKPL